MAERDAAGVAAAGLWGTTSPRFPEAPPPCASGTPSHPKRLAGSIPAAIDPKERLAYMDQVGV